ncbi:DNA-binding transcriptional regulator, LysR family [Glycomyces sambucus]|uniref:DNA-binding transcriptional regulator, LysR family n=1 Tax=Glycomyces sambucus TaxID=380244 RepID=A0A1G9E0G7_9ACTN|nr:LysR family transcriptional regulator [Glycomyces sambucus]SDK69625.1 DNA-binding transcriptional regulator, LysR family [Glycomyces sambucus]
MLDVRRLRLLYEFAAQGSISATALATGQTASAVSQQLAALEKETGVALLERTARSAQLTDAGRRLVAHTARIIEAIDAAETDLAAESAEPRGRVTVTAFPTVAVALAGPIVRRLRRYPELQMVLRQQHTVSESLARVRSGEIDLALIDDWSGQRRAAAIGPLTFHHLVKDPLVAVLPAKHPLAVEEAVSAHALAGEPWIASPAGEPSRTALDRLWRAEGITAPVSEFEGLDTILTLVAKGLGVTVAPWMAAAERRDVAVRAMVEELPGRDVYVVHRTASTGRPAVMTVLQALHQAARKLMTAAERF